MVYEIYKRELAKLREQQNCFYKVVQPILNNKNGNSASEPKNTSSSAVAKMENPPTMVKVQSKTDHRIPEELDEQSDSPVILKFETYGFNWVV